MICKTALTNLKQGQQSFLNGSQALATSVAFISPILLCPVLACGRKGWSACGSLKQVHSHHQLQNLLQGVLHLWDQLDLPQEEEQNPLESFPTFILPLCAQQHLHIQFEKTVQFSKALTPLSCCVA